MIIKLTKPITAHGEEISEINLREPTTEDVCEIGFPFLMIARDGDDAGVELRPKVVIRYISRLGQIPISSASKISLADLSECQAAVMGFFGQ